MKNMFAFFIMILFNFSNAQISDFKSIDFTIADNIAKRHAGYALDNLPLLAHNLTHKLSTKVEKFRAIYYWVCANIEGDQNQNNKINSKRKQRHTDSLDYVKWHTKYKKVVLKKLLKHKKTTCTGYAYLIKELCFLANIECKIVDGYGRTASSNIEELEMANHSWNVVKLKDKWYICDATWSSGYIINNTFINDYNNGYFLTDPILFAKNHYPLQAKWLLNNTLTKTEFTNAPIVYGETFQHKIIPISPNELNIITKKNSEINFSFKTLKTMSETTISLVHFIDIKEQPFKIYDIKNTNGLTTFKYSFKHKGYYDVHLKVNNDIVATYTIHITK